MKWMLLGAAAAVLLAGCATPTSDPVETHTIRIPGPWVFEPQNAIVAANETITFVNDGGAAHSITFAELGIDEMLEPGGSYETVIEERGTYHYTCKLHPPDMKGTLTVR